MPQARKAVPLCFLVLALSLLASQTKAEEKAAPPNPVVALAVPPEAPTYLLISVKGTIGRDFTAETMKAYLDSAEILKPAVVVLEMDTGGGDIRDAEEIVDLMISHKDIRFVALVRRALSAGATITLACKEIYVTETATIGGAVSYHMGQNGLPVQMPADVEEKFQSIWRAVCRKAAEFGGHPSLIAEAMVDPAFTLTMRKEGEKIVLERNGKGDVLKANNRILTLTAREAVSCELAKGVVSDLVALGERLAIPGWKALAVRPGGSIPDRSGAPGEFTPRVFYNQLLQKAVSLKMTEAMTDLQDKKAREAFDLWFKEQRYAGKQVKWTVRVKEATERDTILGSLYSGKDRAEDAQAFPLVLFASGIDEPMILIRATVAKSAGKLLAKQSPGSEVTLSGTIQGANSWYEDKSFLVLAFLDRCSLISNAPVTGTSAATPNASAPGNKKAASDVTGTPAATPNASAPGNKKAASDLNLAQAYRRNGLVDKAKGLLEYIIKTYPETPEATEAQKELQEIQGEVEKPAPAQTGTAPPVRPAP